MALLPISAQDLISRQFFAPSADNRSPLIQALTGAITQGRADAATRDQNQLFSTGAQAAFQGNISPQQQAQLFTANPERAAALLKAAGASTADGIEKLGRTAFRIQGLQDPNQQIAAIDNVIQRIQAGNGDASAWINMRENPGSINQTLGAMTSAATSLSDQISGKLDQDKLGIDKQRVGILQQQANTQASSVASQNRARSIPKTPAQTSIQKNLVAAGFVPGTPEYQAEVLKFIQKPAGTNITIGDSRSLAKATEGQLASAGFANRMANANFEINKLEDEGFDPSDLLQKIGTTVPGGNFLLSEEGQLYEGAKKDLITAILRKESGAAIGVEEFEKEEKKLFPQPGDGKKTIAAKRRRRARAVDNLIKQSKGIYNIQFQTPEDARQEAPDQSGTATVTPVEGGKFQMRIIK